MGDRALIILHSDKRNEISPVCYLHWGGSHVRDLLQETRELMRGRDGDVQYSFARLVGKAHESLEGNLSLGCWSAPTPDAADLGPAPSGARPDAADQYDAWQKAWGDYRRSKYHTQLALVMDKDYSHGDAGVFLVNVDRDTWHAEAFNGYGFDDTKTAEFALAKTPAAV